MIDEKIEEAAKMYAFHKCDERDIDQYDLDSLLFDAFLAGVNWFLDNLWHDSSEEVPKEKELVLVDMGNNEYHSAHCFGERYYIPNVIAEKCRIVKNNEVSRWLYLDDLMKGGK